VGALLLWKPKWEGDQVPCTIRQWDIFEPDRATGRGVRGSDELVEPGSIFVLDGQQRLTSIFRVIFQSRARDRTTPDPDLLVALSPERDWVESPFWLRSRSIHKKMRDGLLVPAEVLFEGVRGGGNESLAIQRAIGEWVASGEELFFKALDRAHFRSAVANRACACFSVPVVVWLGLWGAWWASSGCGVRGKMQA
jgi:hypothetical protein